MNDLEKSEGVIYYNKGTRCLCRLCVSISTLREHYAGNVSLLYEGELSAEFGQFFIDHDISLIQIPEKNSKALARKPQLWRYTPYERTAFLDSDTYVKCSVDQLFVSLNSTEFVVHHFCDWSTTGRRVSKRIKQWECVTSPQIVADALRYGKAVNTGIFAFRLDAKILPAWEDLTKDGYAAGCTPIMVDELACQMLLHQYSHKMLGSEWGASAKFGELKNAKILHYHGQKHVQDNPACELWKNRYEKLLTEYPHLKNSYGDKRLRAYLKTRQPDPDNDLTIVTAVNPDYLKKLQKNFPLWQKMRGIHGKPITVFVNRIKTGDSRLDFLRKCENVTLVPWQFPAAGDNVRERMLSAFVFGVAQKVKTKYWMKLDADCTPKTDEFIYPDYRKYDLVAHKWGYTKVKGDTEKGHWLNRLDYWYDYTIGLNGHKRFPEIEGRRHSHKRTCSFCAIEKTEFTRELAEVAPGRLPIPSQDTFSWYYADRSGRKILKTNMKAFFSP